MVGDFGVAAREMSDLSGFRIHNMTINNVVSTKAFTKDKEQIYHFDRFCPQKNLNVIYDDMPLQGWWPWPKASPVEK